MRYDLLLRNARLVDGTGSPWFRGHVGVHEGRIAFVAKAEGSSLKAEGSSLKAEGSFGTEARRVIDVQDRYLTPGFIDAHTHMDLALLRDPLALPRLCQGVTTQIIGQCGFSVAPVVAAHLDDLERSVAFLSAGVKPNWGWRSFGQWLDTLAALPLGGNVAGHVGHGTLRIAIMGLEDRAATSEELMKMADLLRVCLREGALGMTSGLIYPPGIFANFAELLALARVLHQEGGLYETHMRNESDHVVACVTETIALAEQSKAAVQISHHKASGRRNFGKVHETLALVDAARARGVDVTVNQHPYEIGSTTLRAIFPGWAQEGGFEALVARLEAPETRAQLLKEVGAEQGDWDNYYRNSGGAQGVIFLNMPVTPEVEGKTLAQVAGEQGRDPLEVAFDLVIANKGQDAAAFDNMSTADIETIMRHPATTLISDSIPGPEGAKTHPRISGTCARILDVFVRQRGVLSLEDAIRKMTWGPAQRLNLPNRGLLMPGMAADLLVLDMDRLRDNTTFANPSAKPDGVDVVMVNGQVTVENGQPTDQRAGQVLRGGFPFHANGMYP